MTLAEAGYQHAHARLQLAGEKMATSAKAAFPVGALVEWDHNGHPQRGQVIKHLWGWERWGITITVVNERTGKQTRQYSSHLKRVE